MDKTVNAFHFPHDEKRVWVNTSHCDAQFNIGEKIIIEGDPTIYIVRDVLNQFRIMPENEAGQELMMVTRNIQIEKIMAHHLI